MAQHPIEIILVRQWASYIAAPVWIVDPSGNLLYCNETAESITGVHFDEESDAPVDTYAARFDVCDLDGTPLMTEDLPIAVALAKQMAAHREMRIQDMEGVWRHIEVTGIPLIGQDGHLLGAMAMFWEVGER
ncbi:MAG TPA: PAS domain-containing protein [Acidimicrobiia bacterium]|nr:PAS domain-containing protein [Acidimicrobiia bacterium]